MGSLTVSNLSIHKRMDSYRESTSTLSGNRKSLGLWDFSEVGQIPEGDIHISPDL